jgi:DNA-binding transcriptional LysR family regulator
MDPLDGIAAFARVVESGSFSAAAGRLKISKSAVSAHVQRLEDRLGVRLLNRSTRRLSVTEAGAAYYRHSTRILAEAEAAEQAASALQREPRGTLRISAPDSFGWMHVAPAVPAFLRRYPELGVELCLSSTHVNLVDEGLDLAIRIGVLEDSPLVARRLAPSRLVICAAPAYLKDRGTPREPDELARHNCLCTTLLPWGDEWRLVARRGEVRVALAEPSAATMRKCCAWLRSTASASHCCRAGQCPTRSGQVRCAACLRPGSRPRARYMPSTPTTG